MSNKTDLLYSLSSTYLANNSDSKSCSERFSKFRCYISEYGQTFAYLLLAFALVPQVLHLLKHRHRYIAGISYLWIIIRIFALTLLMMAHAFQWLSTFELIGFLMTMVIFVQIVIFSNNLHRQNKIMLIVLSLTVWIIGRIMIYFFVKQRHLLITIGYVLLAIQMLPQILLNSLLRTTKALSKWSIILLAIGDFILFFNFCTRSIPIVYLIAVYYSSSFLLYICFQNLVHSDEHIHIISRSAHTIMTPGVDIYAGLDVKSRQSIENDPQMFSIEDLEPMEGEDVVYQRVTTNKTSDEPSAITKFAWYAISGCIFCIECTITIVLIYRIGSFWIIVVPLSIFFILGIFYFIRTRLGDAQTEILRKIL